MGFSADFNPTLDEIVESLDADYTGVLPERALRAAQDRRDEITPRLIELIRNATARARDGDTPPGNGHLFALFLLTEFRTKAALPAIIEAVSLPGELPFDLFGDAITESLDSILAAMSSDQPAVLDSIIRDRQVNEYVRWASVRAYEFLVRDQAVTCEHAVQRLREHLWDACIEMDIQIAGPLVSTLAALGPKESLNEIMEAFRRELIDPGHMRIEQVENACARSDEQFRFTLDRLGPTGIQDTVEEFREWAAFSPPSPSCSPAKLPSFVISPGKGAGTPRQTGIELGPSPKHLFNEPLQSNVARVRVGRNEPCPCGSGKKFKKCCGAPK